MLSTMLPTSIPPLLEIVQSRAPKTQNGLV
jgi:hypothetical protein